MATLHYWSITGKTVDSDLTNVTGFDIFFFFFHLWSSGNVPFCMTGQKSYLKGGYLDFSHLIELKNIHITEIYMKKQYKSLIIKNH